MSAPGPWTVRIVDRSTMVFSDERDEWVAIVLQIGKTREEYANLIAAAPDLLAVLQRYVNAYPAFRIKPVGAPGSEKRTEQELLMALEDAAQAAIAKAEGRS